MGSPDPSSGTQGHSAAFRLVRSSGPLRTLPAVYVSAVIDGGSHPFPFRTRKLSLLSPMVLGLRARESRSLQDSRPACRKRRAGLFLCPLHFVTLSRPQPVDTGCLSLTPLAVNGERGFFFMPALSCPRRRAPPSRTRARDGPPPTHEGVASDSVRARGRPTPHTKILSCQSSVFSPQHIIWPQRRDYKNS